LERYTRGENRLFGAGTRQGRASAEDLVQVARDLAELIDRFADHQAVSAYRSFQALVRVFTEHCEVTESDIIVLPKAEDNNAQSARVLQNPSDPDAGYDGHKGPGYQVQLAQAYDTKDGGPGIITACVPQSAAESDSAAITPVLEQQQRMGTTPGAMLADTSYGSQANVNHCASSGVVLLAPTPGKAPCAPCPEHNQPTPAQKAIHARRALETSPSWQREYSKRSGIEGLHEALDRSTGIKRLRVRGAKAVSMSVCFKVTGWNIRSASKILQARLKKSKLPQSTCRNRPLSASDYPLSRPAPHYTLPYYRRLSSINSPHFTNTRPTLYNR
jgi:hypothetical protein